MLDVATMGRVPMPSLAERMLRPWLLTVEKTYYMHSQMLLHRTAELVEIKMEWLSRINSIFTIKSYPFPRDFLGVVALCLCVHYLFLCLTISKLDRPGIASELFYLIKKPV